jgi:hypothetical protein
MAQNMARSDPVSVIIHISHYITFGWPFDVEVMLPQPHFYDDYVACTALLTNM